MSLCVLMYVTDFAGHTTVIKEMDNIDIAIIIIIMTITFYYLFSVKFLSLGGFFVFVFCYCLFFFSFCLFCYFFFFGGGGVVVSVSSGFLPCHISPPPHPNTPHNTQPSPELACIFMHHCDEG